MTPFMTRVAELVGTAPGVTEPPAYRTRSSGGIAANIGADRHIAVRTLAEQLLCEANAVLIGYDDRLTLSDEIGGDELAFTIRHRDRVVRVSTRFADGIAFGQLTGDTVPAGPPRELGSEEDVADLLAALLVQAGTSALRSPIST